MKRIILFFTVCLGLSVSQTTFADNTETARVATKRSPTNTLSANTRYGTTDQKRADTPQQKNVRNAAKPTQKLTSRTQKTLQTVKPRTTTTSQSVQDTPKNVTARTNQTVRNTTTNRTASTRKSAIQTRAASTTRNKGKISRAAELSAEKIASIKSADYSKCKTVYYECMDEFCANKDANLRRCACSSRIHEFDIIKKQLSDVVDKMLDFNQRLLLVNLDKEDAAAVNVATDGELAFEKKDTSESEKLLQKITSTLNSSGDSRINNNLSAISLSLNIDDAWDNLDSLSGVATASKNGLDLYKAAQPICIEMAKEVCSDDELIIAQDGYKLTIQQDCNTVAKSYNALYNSTMAKIHESSALLDMSRLNAYQQRNSDDTLTCKKKILEQLSDASVCGENLYKCLDITGQYIDPSNGNAFLSENLHDLSNLIQEPKKDEKWSNIAKNESFVSFLKSKKKFLEPAIQQCQAIADVIWNEFLDDALSQIKLAQNAKLEEIRQSCTTLLTECKSNALDDLSEFDARSLSTFNVIADKTANEMCSDIQKSCIALMDESGTNYWESGVIGISKDLTYKSIIDTCTQIGRDCIIQNCNGTSGNFALCADITSDKRMAIINRDVCWQEIYNCVKDADNLNNMNTLPIIANRQGYYNSLYNATYSDIPVFCDNMSGTERTACLITEQIWGNCENNPTNNQPITSHYRNRILQPNSGSTLLSWLANNTSTSNNDAGCSAYGCPANYTKDLSTGTCQPIISQSTGDCNTATQRTQIINVILNALTNYCPLGKHDMFHNCCANGATNNGICVPDENTNALLLFDTVCNASDYYYCHDYSESNQRQIKIYCVTTDSSIIYDSTDSAFECPNGKWVLVDQYGNYFDIESQNDAPSMTYKNCGNTCSSSTPSCSECKYEHRTTWAFYDGAQTCTDISDSIPTNNEFMVTY